MMLASSISKKKSKLIAAIRIVFLVRTYMRVWKRHFSYTFYMCSYQHFSANSVYLIALLKSSNRSWKAMLSLFIRFKSIPGIWNAVWYYFCMTHFDPNMLCYITNLVFSFFLIYLWRRMHSISGTSLLFVHSFANPQLWQILLASNGWFKLAYKQLSLKIRKTSEFFKFYSSIETQQFECTFSEFYYKRFLKVDTKKHWKHFDEESNSLSLI